MPGNNSIENLYDIEEIESLLRPAIYERGLVDVVGKECLLFIGNKGVGKSTAINYLNGWDFRKCRRSGLVYMEQFGETNKPFLPVGHDIEAKTFYPQAVTTLLEKKDLAYVDMPGFKDNRSKEYSICTSYLRPLAVKAMKSVRGIVLCMRWDKYDIKAESLEALVEMISEIFTNKKNQNFSQISSGLFITITKAGKHLTVNDVVERFEAFKEKLEDDLKKKNKKIKEKMGEALKNVDSQGKVSGGSVTQKIKQLVLDDTSDSEEVFANTEPDEKVLSLVNQIILCGNSGRLHILRPNDNGKSRTLMLKDLFNHCNTNKIVEKSQFRLALDYLDNTRSTFNRMIDWTLERNNTVILKGMKAKKLLENAQEDLERTQGSLERQIAYTNELQKFKQRRLALEATVQRFTTMIKATALAITEKQCSIAELQGIIDNLSHQIALYDVEEYVDHVKLEESFTYSHTLVLASAAGLAILVSAGLTGAGAVAGIVAVGDIGIGPAVWGVANAGFEAMVAGVPIHFILRSLKGHVFKYEDDLDIGHCKFNRSCDFGGGWFYNVKINPNENSYQVSFAANPCVDSQAVLLITKPKKYKFAKDIALLREQLAMQCNIQAACEQFLQVSRKELSDYQETKLSTENEIKEIDQSLHNREENEREEADINDLLSKALEIQEEIETRIANLEELIAINQSEIKSVIQYLEDKQGLYNVIHFLNQIDQFESLVVQNFLDNFPFLIPQEQPTAANIEPTEEAMEMEVETHISPRLEMEVETHISPHLEKTNTPFWNSHCTKIVGGVVSAAVGIAAYTMYSNS
ncbi:MAG: AAA family ATPase [Gammaproteobacteria bacterium]